MSSPLLCSESNYVKEFVDSGNFGNIFKITLKENHKVFALKQIDLKKFPLADRGSALNDAISEYQLLRKGIPNLLRSHGSFYDSQNNIFRYSTDLMEMNLTQLIEKNGPLNFQYFSEIFNDILEGQPFPFNTKLFYLRFNNRSLGTAN